MAERRGTCTDPRTDPGEQHKLSVSQSIPVRVRIVKLAINKVTKERDRLEIWASRDGANESWGAGQAGSLRETGIITVLIVWSCINLWICWTFLTISYCGNSYIDLQYSRLPPRHVYWLGALNHHNQFKNNIRPSGRKGDKINKA